MAKNTLKWPSCENLIPKLFQHMNKKFEEDPQHLTEKLVRRVFKTKVSASVKYDGTNFGKDEEKTLYGRNFTVAEEQASYQHTHLAFLRKEGELDVGKAKSALEAELEREANADGLVSLEVAKLVVYGELMCNASLYDYDAKRLNGKWLAFGALADFLVAHEADSVGAEQSGETQATDGNESEEGTAAATDAAADALLKKLRALGFNVVVEADGTETKAKAGVDRRMRVKFLLNAKLLEFLRTSAGIDCCADVLSGIERGVVNNGGNAEEKGETTLTSYDSLAALTEDEAAVTALALGQAEGFVLCFETGSAAKWKTGRETSGPLAILEHFESAVMPAVEAIVAEAKEETVTVARLRNFVAALKRVQLQTLRQRLCGGGKLGRNKAEREGELGWVTEAASKPRKERTGGEGEVNEPSNETPQFVKTVDGQPALKLVHEALCSAKTKFDSLEGFLKSALSKNTEETGAEVAASVEAAYVKFLADECTGSGDVDLGKFYRFSPTAEEGDAATIEAEKLFRSRCEAHFRGHVAAMVAREMKKIVKGKEVKALLA